jgi:hypothetical protein
VDRIEARLTDAFHAAASTITPESIPGLGQRSRRFSRRRMLAPLGAAAAVAAVIAASVLVPLLLTGHARTPTTSPRHSHTSPAITGTTPSPTPSPSPTPARSASPRRSHASVLPSPSVSPSATASPPGTTSGCVTQNHPADAADGQPAGFITVCPGSAAVGTVVQITLQGCSTSTQTAAAAMSFLGPTSWLGTGGGGNNVPLTPDGGDRATATFTIPSTYVGGVSGAEPNPVLPVTPSAHYSFGTYPAGICDVSFTVTP